MKQARYIYVSFLIVVAFVFLTAGGAHYVYAVDTATEQHDLAFASDLHDTEGALEGALSNFPDDIEYISLIGDMVGAKGGDAPAFNSSDILARIRAIDTCGNIAADGSNASIIWADHDAGVNDDADIVKCMGDPAGYLSGQIYEGRNQDGSTAYYIYAVGFYHMLKGGDISREAAGAFKEWVDGKDETVPVIVLCHAPLVAKRGDNYGAAYWNEALNYAATGVEGIDSVDTTGIPVIRNVIFMSGHNHTVDPNEYVYSVGSTMSVQVDTSIGMLASSQEEDTHVTEDYDEEVADLQDLQGSHPNVTATGKASIVYYTALTPGYLKTSQSATLVSITDKEISFTKYNQDGQTDLGVTAAGDAVSSPLVIDGSDHHWGAPSYVWSKDNSSVTAKRTCSVCGKEETETVATSKSVAKKATCTEKGKIKYTAKFSNSAFKAQTKTEADIAKVDLGTTRIGSIGSFKNKTFKIGMKGSPSKAWAKANNATGYKVSYKLAGANKWTTKTTTARRYTIKNMKAYGCYDIRVQATKKATAATAAVTGKASNTVHRYMSVGQQVKVIKGKGKITVKWKKDSKATSYQVLCSTSKSMKNARIVNVKSSSITKKVVKGLKRGKKYYIQVRPMKKYKGTTYYGILGIRKAVNVK